MFVKSSNVAGIFWKIVHAQRRPTLMFRDNYRCLQLLIFNRITIKKVFKKFSSVTRRLDGKYFGKRRRYIWKSDPLISGSKIGHR